VPNPAMRYRPASVCGRLHRLRGLPAGRLLARATAAASLAAAAAAVRGRNQKPFRWFI